MGVVIQCDSPQADTDDPSERVDMSEAVRITVEVSDASEGTNEQTQKFFCVKHADAAVATLREAGFDLS